MSYIDKLITARSEMNSLLLAEQNSEALLLKGGEQAFIGACMMGDKVVATYDSQVINVMGIDPEKQRELDGVAFLLQAYLSLDNAALAVMNQLEKSGEAKVNDDNEPVALTKERMELTSALGTRFAELLKDCMEADLDLSACISMWLQEKAEK